LNTERVLDVIASPKRYKKHGKAKFDIEEGGSESEVIRVPELSESRRVHAVGSRRIPPHKKSVVDVATPTISLRPLSLSEPHFGTALSTKGRKRKRDDSPLSSVFDKVQDVHSSSNVEESLQSRVVKDTSISTRRSGRLKEVPMQSLTSKALVKVC